LRRFDQAGRRFGAAPVFGAHPARRDIILRMWEEMRQWFSLPCLAASATGRSWWISGWKFNVGLVRAAMRDNAAPRFYGLPSWGSVAERPKHALFGNAAVSAAAGETPALPLPQATASPAQGNAPPPIQSA
jgi:hypothetical protein